MPCAWISHRDCLLHEMGPGHPECPERLDAISDHLLSQGLMSLLIPYDAPEATVEQLERAHTAHHVTEMFAAVPAEGYVHVDPDTAMNPHSIKAALRPAGAAVSLAARRSTVPPDCRPMTNSSGPPTLRGRRRTATRSSGSSRTS